MAVAISSSNCSGDNRVARVGHGRIKALLLLAVVAAPLILAYAVYFSGIGVPAGTINKGELIEPARDLKALNLVDQQGQKIMADGRKWRLLIPYRKDCGELCANNLYTTRQVHVRLGDKARRLERVLINFDNSDTDNDDLSALKQQHPRLRIAAVNAQDFTHYLGQRGSLSLGQYYLVDQEGFAMMAYSPEHHGNELLTDIKRTLKFSYED
ncbi:MAG: hypothetical protein OIF35_01150 [Cellvibrionaceae bacterium]|nr:hypothetical protein [Cellvibrionaceae bacterium]